MVVTHGSLRSARSRTTLTIGNFDGVHRGHRALIERVVAKGRELQVPSCVLTFEPHPREFFAPERAPARLTRLRDKLELIAAAGIERVHLVRFDARLAAMSAARSAFRQRISRSRRSRRSLAFTSSRWMSSAVASRASAAGRR